MVIMKKLKRCLIIILSVLIPVVCAVTTASAKTTVDGDYTYTALADNTACINSYNGKAESLIIPGEIGGMTVSSIGSGAFENNNNLVSVEMPDTITAIESSVFVVR